MTGGVAEGRLGCGRELQELCLALDVWGGQRILQNGGRHVDSTAKKWGCCNAGRVGDVEHKSARNSHRNILMLPALLIWGREESR